MVSIYHRPTMVSPSVDKNSQQFVNMSHPASATLEATQYQNLTNNLFQIQQSNVTGSKLKYSMCRLKTMVICVEAQHSN